MRRWRALAIAPLAALLVTGPVLAQDSTPEADSAENPRLVDPSECVAEPRAYDDIATILELDGEGVPAPAMTQITPPLGEIADVETTISIKEAARQVLACFNAGDIPRAAGLMTENGVRRAYWGLTIDAENRAAGPHPHRRAAPAADRRGAGPAHHRHRRLGAPGWANRRLRRPQRAAPAARRAGDAALHLRQRGRPVARRRLDRLLDRSARTLGKRPRRLAR